MFVKDKQHKLYFNHATSNLAIRLQGFDSASENVPKETQVTSPVLVLLLYQCEKATYRRGCMPEFAMSCNLIQKRYSGPAAFNQVTFVFQYLLIFMLLPLCFASCVFVLLYFCHFVFLQCHETLSGRTTVVPYLTSPPSEPNWASKVSN